MLCVNPRAAQAHDTSTYYSFYLYANVQRVKRDMFAADIYYYITTEFDYAKRDSRHAAYGGVVLHRSEFLKVCKGKNGNRHFSLNFDIFCNKNHSPKCLVVFSIVISLLSSIRSF